MSFISNIFGRGDNSFCPAAKEGEYSNFSCCELKDMKEKVVALFKLREKVGDIRELSGIHTHQMELTFERVKKRRAGQLCPSCLIPTSKL